MLWFVVILTTPSCDVALFSSVVIIWSNKHKPNWFKANRTIVCQQKTGRGHWFGCDRNKGWLKKIHFQFVNPRQGGRKEIKRLYWKFLFSIAPLLSEACYDLNLGLVRLQLLSQGIPVNLKSIYITSNSTFHLYWAVCWFLWLETESLVYSVTPSDKDRQGLSTFWLCFSFFVLQGHFTRYLKSWEKSIDCSSHYLQC